MTKEMIASHGHVYVYQSLNVIVRYATCMSIGLFPRKIKAQQDFAGIYNTYNRELI